MADPNDSNPKQLLEDALQARSRIQSLSLNLSSPIIIKDKWNEVSQSAQVGSVKDVASKLRTLGTFAAPNQSKSASNITNVKYSEIEEYIESKKIGFQAESSGGVRVIIPEKNFSSQTEASRFAIARSIQLADKVISNDVSFELAGLIMKHGINLMTTAPDWCLNVVSAAVSKVYSESASKELILEAPKWTRKVVRVRIAVQRWGHYFGLGYQLKVCGRVNLYKRSTSSKDFVGKYLCTCITSSALGNCSEGSGFMDNSSETIIQNSIHHRDGLNITSAEWESEEHDEDGDIWEDVTVDEDVEDGSKIDDAVISKESGLPRLSSSSGMQVLCWGDNEHGELSDMHTIIPSATVMSWQPITPWEYVRCLATSASHTILATSSGSVYTCGDGSEGALGHGDLERSQKMRPVVWFAELVPTPDIVAVAAGADLFGSHSMALDSKGKVYTWGIGSACGRGTRKPLPEPALVEELQEFINFIDCGGGYCVAMSKQGELFTWGNWTGGRLGLGPVPSKSDPSYLHGRGRKRLLPLLLYPKQVPLDGVMLQKVSCGDTHTAAITKSGALLVWGQNESGQLGLGPSSSTGQFESAFTPVQVPCFNGGGGERTAVFVACGTSHTLVIDGSRDVWTWGALGGSCLGHGSGDYLNGKPSHTFRPTSELQAARAVRQRAGVITAEVPAWSVPRRCSSLSGYGAESASLGERHTAVLLKSGRLVMCGDGVALAHHLTAKEGQSTTDIMSQLDAAEPVSVMRMPCASWFPSLEGKYISSVHCGGQHTIVLSRGEHIGITLGWKLLQAARRSFNRRHIAENEEERAWNELDVLSEGCDCVIITSGSVLPAHRVILAKRSRVLRELIAEEEIPGNGGVLELLLPDLRHDTALALREYIYTDTVSYPLEPGYSLPLDLMTAADTYDLPRLKALCLSAMPETVSNVSARMSVPCSQIATEFGNALGDSNWSDVTFVAEGRNIYAHISILSVASDYFANMFRFGSGEEAGVVKEALEVVVPDSYVGMLRMLLWIYTGYIDSSDESILLEDLLAADRFQLLSLKSTCESLIDVSAENCVSVLEVAHLVNAKRLQEDALGCLARSLHIQEVSDAAMELVNLRPEVGEELFKRLSQHSCSRSRDKHHVATISRKEASEDERLAQQNGVFPIVPLLLSLLFAFLFAYTSRFVVFGPLVPIINIAGLVGIVAWGLQTVRSS